MCMILTMTCYPNRLEIYYLKTALQDATKNYFLIKLPKHNFTRIWNKTGSTLAHGKNRLTFKRLLKNIYLEAYESQIQCINPRCTDCCDR